MKRADFLQRLISVAIFGKLPISALITKRKVYLLHDGERYLLFRHKIVD